MVFSVGRVVCTKTLPILPVWWSVWGGWSVLKYYLYCLYGGQCGRVVCTKILPILPVWWSVWGGWSVLKYYLYYLYGGQCGEGGLY